jgi:addiction module RelE/StbE family toxin
MFLSSDKRSAAQIALLDSERKVLYLDLDSLLQKHPILPVALDTLAEKIYQNEVKLSAFSKNIDTDFSNVFDPSSKVPSLFKSKLMQVTAPSFSILQWRRRSFRDKLSEQELLSFFYRENIALDSIGSPRTVEPSVEVDFARQDVTDTIIDKNVRYSLVPEKRSSGATAFRTQHAVDRDESWMSIFTRQFKKNMTVLDKKLQGRAMEAILEISENPLQVRGDTVKKLSGSLTGMWRYRIGDYRLVYEPLPKIFKIFFIDIGSRGGVYDVE